jgi:hypothetical protein
MAPSIAQLPTPAAEPVEVKKIPETTEETPKIRRIIDEEDGTNPASVRF